MKNNFFPKNVRRMALFYSFTNPFNVWFNRRQLYSHTASAFNLMSYVVLVELYEENPASHKHAVGKGRGNLIAFQIIVAILL